MDILSSPILPLFDLTPHEVMDDVYFLKDFVALHAAPDPIDSLEEQNFRHCAAVRVIAGTGWTDIETPHGYGGPIATSLADMRDGLDAWKWHQRQQGRVAELIRFHPCLNPEAFAGALSFLRFNRPTVMIDLRPEREQRLAGYSVTTRQNVRKTRRTLSTRRLEPTDWPLLKQFYEQMLIRQRAESRYYFSDEYYRILFCQDWCHAFVVEQDQQPLGVACFLASTVPLAHYHLSGASDDGLRQRVHYLMIDAACDYFSQRGKQWLHLGGGRTPAPDDSLWLFKAQFSGHHTRFFIGGIVHDPARYASLGGSGDGMFLGYRANHAGEPINRPPDDRPAPPG